MSVGAALIYLAVFIVVCFVASGVVPRYLAVRRRRPRVEEFERQYLAYVEAREGDWERTYPHHGRPPHGEESQKIRDWLAPRRDEMQRDARAVGRGVVHVAPPPAAGGGSYQPHAIFADLFDRQSFTGHSHQFRLDELASVAHETRRQESIWKRDLLNPWAWLRFAFERVVGFPRYVLLQAGFSAKATDTTAARLISVLWSALVGAAGIGGFVVALVK
jgi:hypothetical protein